MIPILKPKLPVFAKYQQYLAEIDNNRTYSNFGMLNSRLEKRIAELADLSLKNVSTISNATLGITCLLGEMKIKNRKYCIIPSWTFIATAAAVLNCGLEPIFVDVENDSWVLDLQKVKKTIEQNPDEISAIIVVSPFGEIIDLEKWEKFSKESGIPVIIDAAAGFDSFVANKNIRFNSLPVVVSLHATKIFGIGEGGLIFTRDEKLLKTIRNISNFGISGIKNGLRKIEYCGTNAKLSEYSAAVAMGFLDDWLRYRRECSEVVNYYCASLRKENIPYFYPKNSLSLTLSIIVKDADKMASYLESKGVATKKWWDHGCHNLEFYKNFKHDGLEVTERLGNSVLGIPLFVDITHNEIEHIIKSIKEFL